MSSRFMWLNHAHGVFVDSLAGVQLVWGFEMACESFDFIELCNAQSVADMPFPIRLFAISPVPWTFEVHDEPCLDR